MKQIEPFRFKQFSVSHEKSSIRIGMDGVLIGAWGAIEGKRGLDVGCGCGLIALMAAQRNPNAIIDAVDIDEASVMEASNNFSSSPWSNHLNAFVGDATLTLSSDFQSEEALATLKSESYDFIISNPPFFSSGVFNPQTAREKARHAGSLSPVSLLTLSEFLLKPKGTLSFIMPFQNIDHLPESGLELISKCEVADREGKTPKRVMLTYMKETAGVSELPLKKETLIIRDKEGNYTKEYKILTKDFYLGLP